MQSIKRRSFLKAALEASAVDVPCRARRAAREQTVGMAR